MIKIIKRGNPRSNDKALIRQFECKECGCIFNCNSDYWKYEPTPWDKDRDIITVATCPTCGQKIYGSKPF